MISRILLLLLSVSSSSETAAEGRPWSPAPRGSDGRFLNASGPLAHAGLRVTLPFFARRALGSFREFRSAPEQMENDGAFLRKNAGHSVPTATWIGHATLLIQMGHKTFLTDPIWSPTASPLSFAGPRRFVPPGLPLDALPPIDFVLISHNHYDHLDAPTLRALAERHPDARFFVPLANAKTLHKLGIKHVSELDWGEHHSLDGLTIYCLPAQHWSRRGLSDERRALWSSWAVLGAEQRFYFGGDSGYWNGFAAIGGALGPFDLAALPIGAYEPAVMMRPWHLNPEEAARAGRDLRARRVLGIHFGTFDLTDEPLDEPPRRFRAAASRQNYAADDVWVLRIGETRTF